MVSIPLIIPALPSKVPKSGFSGFDIVTDISSVFFPFSAEAIKTGLRGSLIDKVVFASGCSH